jgi:protocatechuate 3,4-dioxygenase beta subunit
VLTPEQTEGPFFFDTGWLRRDITEGKPGEPLRLTLQLVNVDAGCAPIRDAVVEAWHADADGVYSGFNRSAGNLADTAGETFLRGYQVSDDNGRVEFDSIYPGWYPGRTVHIHLKVILDGTRLLTTQLYFPDELTDAVHALEPYNARGARDTTNGADSIFTGGGSDSESLILDVAVDETGYVGALVLGIANG